MYMYIFFLKNQSLVFIQVKLIPLFISFQKMIKDLS